MSQYQIALLVGSLRRDSFKQQAPSDLRITAAVELCVLLPFGFICTRGRRMIREVPVRHQASFSDGRRCIARHSGEEAVGG
jgi:hypothetical protein